MKPTLSIVIAAYNAENSISRCLDSLGGEYEGALEVVVIDDGSTDSTRDIVSSYAHSDQSITLISQENRGTDYARARGIASSHGEFVLCVDADDFLLSGAIAILLRCIQDYPHVDMIWFQYCTDVSRPEGADKGISRLPKLGIFEGADLIHIHQNIFQGLSNTLWNKVFRREMFADDERVSRARYYGEDFSRVLSALSEVASCLVINDVLYCYVDTAGSISKQFKLTYLDDIKLVSQQLLEIARKDGNEGIRAAGTGILAQYYNLFVLSINAGDSGTFAEVAVDLQQTLAMADLPKGFTPSNRKLRLIYSLVTIGNLSGLRICVMLIERIKHTVWRIEEVVNA